MIQPWLGKQEPINDYDLPNIGHRIGVGEDIVHMILEVESKGKGFDANGVIKLFEKHVFYRNLPPHLKSKALEEGIASIKWKRDYNNNHAAFLKAYKFDKSAALKGCSWGLGQVLGENFKMLNYTSPAHMVQTFANSEAAQLNGMIDFIIHNNLADELRAMEDTTDYNELLRLARVFARVYNGPGYEKHNYHGRLVNSLKKWRNIPDTHWTPELSKKEEFFANKSITIAKEVKHKTFLQKLFGG